MNNYHGYVQRSHREEEVSVLSSKSGGTSVISQHSRTWGVTKKEMQLQLEDFRELRQYPTSPTASMASTIREIRQGPSSPSKRTSAKINEMKLKFEQGAATKEQTAVPNKAWTSSCGSPVAERRRQLQQQFFGKDEEDAPRCENNSQKTGSTTNSNESTANKARKGNEEANGNTKQLCQTNQHSPKRVAEIIASGKTSQLNHTSHYDPKRVAEFLKKKKVATRTHERRRSNEKVIPRKNLPLEPDGARGGVPQVGSLEENPTIEMVMSDSEMSPLEYTGSLLPEEKMQIARDEAEDPRPSQALDSRDMETSEGYIMNDPSGDSAGSNNNSFQEALRCIVESFEKDLSIHHQRVVDGVMQCRRRSLPETSHRIFDMETGRVENASPLSMLTDLETDPSGLMTLEAMASMHVDDLAKPNRTGKYSTSASKSAWMIKRKVKDLSSTRILPDRSLFVTVDQEEERERANDADESIFNDVSEEEDWNGVEERQDSATGLAKGKFSVRYHLKDKPVRDKKPVKGILKNNQDPVQMLSPGPLQVLSSGSWYSSAASAVSEASQQLSPPALVNKNLFSVGECVNAHLAEHPKSSFSERSNGQDDLLQDFTCNAGLNFPLPNMNSAGSDEKSGATRSHVKSPDSMEAMVSPSNSEDHKELRDIAKTMSKMANKASSVFLDVFISAADKVVVTPLISIFNCVDANEDMLCSGSTNDIMGDFDPQKVRTAKKKRRSRSLPRFRKFT